MSTLIANADGNLTGSSTFAAVETGANALKTIRNNSNGSLSSPASQASPTFTITNGSVIDGVVLWMFKGNGTTTGTVKVDLQKGGVSQVSVTVSKNDIPDNSAGAPQPVFFKFPSTVTGDGGSNWTIVLSTTVAETGLTYYRNSTTAGDFTRALRTTTAATPAAGDDLYVVGELTGAGTHNSRSVTMDSTAATAYGNGSVNSTSVAGGLIAVGSYGTLSYGISVSTNYILRVAGDLIVYQYGTLNIGSNGSEIPRNSTAVLEFQPVSADGDFGLQIRGGTFNGAGLSRTSGKNVVKCKLIADVSASGTSLSVDTDTGWLSGDVICIASTTRTRTDCESIALGANATSSSMTVAALANTHSGTSPTQAEVGLLTRNVKIRSTSSSLMTYVVCTSASTVTASWVEFQYIGKFGTTDKHGIEIYDGSTAGAKVFSYCSIHDGKASGFYYNVQQLAAVNLSVDNCVLWSLSVDGVTLNIGGGPADWSFTNNLVMLVSGSGFNLADINGTCTGNTSVGSSGPGFIIMQNAAPGGWTINDFSGNTAHSGNNTGILVNNLWGTTGVIDNFTAWRNAISGVVLSAGVSYADISFNNLVLFGNTTTNFDPGSNIDFLQITGTSIIAGDASFSTAQGINFKQTSNGAMVSLDISGIDFSGTGTGLAAHTTSDLFFPTNQYSIPRGVVNNCKFSSKPINSKLLWLPSAYISFQMYNQTNGDHRTEMAYGQLKTDIVIYNTASPSMRMTPSDASNKLESAPTRRGILVPVANGAAMIVSVYVRKSVSGDGAAYSGNQPRLIQRANPALGQNSDVVLATASGAAGSWEKLTGTTSTATDDGAWEIIVDCDGTAGWINVDDFDWSVA